MNKTKFVEIGESSFSFFVLPPFPFDSFFWNFTTFHTHHPLILPVSFLQVTYEVLPGSACFSLGFSGVFTCALISLLD